MDDAKILRLLKKHDENGLTELISKYNRLACFVAHSLLGSGEDALECVNDAYYGIWKAAPATELSRMSLRGWVCLIVRRRAIDMLRKRGGAMAHLDDDMAAAITHMPEEHVLSGEAVKRIERFARGLPMPDRQIFNDRFFMLSRIDDIAKRTGLSRGAVDTRLTRIRAKLRSVLEEEGANV